MKTVTIFHGLSVGSEQSAQGFLPPEGLRILVLVAIAFGFGTASGVLMGKLMNRFSVHKINPLIGADVCARSEHG
jgi:carboxybiotin decarboxylase